MRLTRPMSKVLVTGGTGALGRQVVKLLRDAGHRAVVMSRSPGEGEDWRQADLATGAGLEAAVHGMDAVIHAGSATTPGAQALRGRATDVEGTRLLVGASHAAGVGHFVHVSIVGMDGIPYPYYELKLAAERIVKAAPLPWTILRATQFHTLMEVFLAPMARLPGLLTLPGGWQFQPVDTRDVAARLVGVVEAEPAGLLPDFGGPEVLQFDDIAMAWAAARGMKRRVVHVPMPMKFSAHFAAGRLLSPDHREGTVTFGQYLARRYPPK